MSNAQATVDLLTAEQVAERLHLRPITVMEWFRQGRIPGLKITGRVVRFDWDSVVSALRKLEKKKTPRTKGGAL